MRSIFCDRNSLLGILSLLQVCLVIGCGGSSTPAPDKPASTTAAKVKTETKQDAASEEVQITETGNVRTDADGQKWIGDIPYDVFFDDPLAIASDQTAVGGGATVASNTNMPAGAAPATTPTPATPPPSSAGGSFDWKSLITMEQINEETKRIRNHLTASLQSQGTYNGNMKELQWDGAAVSAIALIVAQHPEDVTWKKNARFLREFGYKLNQSATALGRESFTASQLAAENIQAVLNGNLPAEAGDPAEMVPFAEQAGRAGVMRRIEKASEWMRANINSESVFESETEKIRQESAVLGALAKMIADKSYDSADEEDYANYARNLLEGATETGAAAAEKSYTKFSDGINKVQKACGECHADYGTG